MGQSLVNYFRSLGTPQWGQVDCNVIALDLLNADVPPVRGQYSTELGAFKFYKKYPLRWDEVLPQYAQPVKKNFAQVGDLLITNHDKYVEIRFWMGTHVVSIDMQQKKIITTRGMPLDVNQIWRVKNGK